MPIVAFELATEVDDAIAMNPSTKTQSLSESVLDDILTWQFLVAWAGEGNGELQRLGWWRTDLTDELGGGDFFRRLLPKTGRWAALEAVRQAAIQHDQKIRQRLSQPDLANTLFFWGFAMDERLADRIGMHKRSEQLPSERLPLPMPLEGDFVRADFENALKIAGQAASYKIVPDGREMTGALSVSYGLRAHQLAAALLPLKEHYSMPFYRLETPNAV